MRALALILCVGCTSFPNPSLPFATGSVGLPHHGVLTRGVPIENKSTGYERLRNDERAFGTRSMVATLQAACAQVGTPIAPCVIADLSGPLGGALLPKHASHRTGRDADVLFFVTDLNGRPVRSPGFVRFEKHGLGQGENGIWVRFDTARNWALVRALVSGSESQVEWIFVHPVIRDWLLRYAEGQRESIDVRTRAQTVLGIAGGPKAPHDDHMHIRVSCTHDELGAGCIPSAATRDWVHTLPSPVAGATSDSTLAEALFGQGDS